MGYMDIINSIEPYLIDRINNDDDIAVARTQQLLKPHTQLIDLLWDGLAL